MDIFRYNSPVAATKLEQGEVVNGLKSKMWIERYARDGEFKFVANADISPRELLPIGSFITHIDSKEVMIVENHEISDDKGKETEVIITGRGFETFYENRIVGSNRTFPVTGEVSDYILAAGYTWNQIVTLIREHTYASSLIDDDNAIPYVEALASVSGTGASAQRALKRGTLYSRVTDLLKVDDLGIKVIRPGPWSPLATKTNIAVVIHKGVDRRANVIFSYDTGEIESADYLWSNKRLKNCAMVSGKWVEVLVDGPSTEYNRRMMFVDASDIDNPYQTAPSGTDLTNVQNAMQQRGIEALADQKDIALTKAEVSENVNKVAYRTDFDVGDIITVNGDYNETTSMRISEYVEIEDEEGSRGYPTLSSI